MLLPLRFFSVSNRIFKVNPRVLPKICQPTKGSKSMDEKNTVGGLWWGRKGGSFDILPKIKESNKLSLASVNTKNNNYCGPVTHTQMCNHRMLTEAKQCHVLWGLSAKASNLKCNKIQEIQIKMNIFYYRRLLCMCRMGPGLKIHRLITINNIL